MNRDDVYGIIKAHCRLDNKTAYHVAGMVWKDVKRWHKAEVEADKKKERSSVKALTDEERAEALAALLDEKLISKEITAAELAQLKDVFNLKQKDRDIIIRVISYADYEEENVTVDASDN